MIESFSAALYTDNKDTKTYLNCPLYPHRVELQKRPVPHFHEERGVGIAGVLLSPSFKRMDGRYRQPRLGRAGWASSLLAAGTESQPGA